MAVTCFQNCTVLVLEGLSDDLVQPLAWTLPLTQREDWLVDCWTVRCLKRHFGHEAGFLGSTQQVPALTPTTSPSVFLAEDLKSPSFLA